MSTLDVQPGCSIEISIKQWIWGSVSNTRTKRSLFYCLDVVLLGLRIFSWLFSLADCNAYSPASLVLSHWNFMWLMILSLFSETGSCPASSFNPTWDSHRCQDVLLSYGCGSIPHPESVGKHCNKDRITLAQGFAPVWKMCPSMFQIMGGYGRYITEMVLKPTILEIPWWMNHRYPSMRSILWF